MLCAKPAVTSPVANLSLRIFVFMGIGRTYLI